MLPFRIHFASLISVLYAASIKEPERHHVIVVGAGVSGLTAAATLLEHGVQDVLILEAADRIGGRTHTVEFGGVDIDKGAEFIHGQEKNVVYDLLKPYDLLVSYDSVTQVEQSLYVNTSGYVFNSSLTSYVIEQGMNKLYDEGLKSHNQSLFHAFNTRTGWASNLFTLGAYSYRTQGSDADNNTGVILADPILQDEKPVVLFAGEATHPHYFSTVHGALETGRRETKRIIDYIKDHQTQYYDRRSSRVQLVLASSI